jgi:hypothetical protein
MAFSDIELKGIDNVIRGLCRRRTRPELRDQLRFEYLTVTPLACASVAPAAETTRSRIPSMRDDWYRLLRPSSITLATLVGMAYSAHRQSTQLSDALPQCYALRLGACEWSMAIPDYWLNRSADAAFPRRLPATIRLETHGASKDEPGATWNGGAPAVRPCPSSEFDPRYKLGTWRGQPAGSVQIAWGGGLGGVVLTVPELDSSMRGTITTWSDAMGNPMPICGVRLHRKACDCS